MSTIQNNNFSIKGSITTVKILLIVFGAGPDLAGFFWSPESWFFRNLNYNPHVSVVFDGFWSLKRSINKLMKLESYLLLKCHIITTH